MEPFSIATGCASVLSTIIAASIQINTFVAGVRDAQRDMKAVSRELVSLRLCLEKLQNDSNTIIYPAGLEEHIKAVLSNCDLVVADIRKLVKYFESANLIRRIQWTAAGSTQMDKLRVSLESHKSALEIALCMTSILMLSNLKNDTTLIKAQNDEIRDGIAELPAIRQDTSQIAFLVEEVRLLRTQMAALKQSDCSGHFLLQRFLNESTSYAESFVGFEDHENSAEEFNVSNDEADLEFSPLQTGAESAGLSSEGSLFVARLSRFSFQADSESSVTTESLMQEILSPRIQNRSPTPASEDSEIRLTSSPPTPEEVLSAEELPEGELASIPSGTSPDQLVVAPIRAANQSIDYPVISTPMAARAALTLKQKIALDIRLRVAVQGIPYGGKGFASFRLGNELGSLQEIREILDAGADVTLFSTPGFAGLIDDKDKMNALDFEINNAKREDVVDLLLSRGSSPNGLKIHTAIKRGDEMNLKKLLEYEANPKEWDDYNRSALYRAAERDSETMIAILLRHGASTQDSISYDTSEALEIACKMGHINAVRALLEAGATTRYPGRGAPWKRKVQLKPEIIALIEQQGGFRKRNSREETSELRAVDDAGYLGQSASLFAELKVAGINGVSETDLFDTLQLSIFNPSTSSESVFTTTNQISMGLKPTMALNIANNRVH